MQLQELESMLRLFLHHAGGICRPLTWRERVKVAIGFSRGLKYLHEINIIHGNLKPSNILLTHEFNPLVISRTFGGCKAIFYLSNFIPKYILPLSHLHKLNFVLNDACVFSLEILALAKEN